MVSLGTLISRFGKIVGRNSIKIVMPGRQVGGITAFSYKDNEEKDNIYGAGEFPVGRDEGNYKAEALIILLKEEMNALQLTLGSGERLTDIESPDTPVTYEYKGLVMKDVIRNVEFTDNDVGAKQDDKNTVTQFTPLPSHTDWNAAMWSNNRLKGF